LFEMFRDPRYLAPLGVLLGVIFVSAVLARNGPGRYAAASVPSPASMATSAANQGGRDSPPTTEPPPPTPDDAAIDARRTQDLVKVRDALLVYRRQHGKFPVTKNGITTLCTQPLDPGCVLGSGAGPPPFADGDQPYWYLSDGARVVLVARAQAATDASQCPAMLPIELTGSPLICLKFERPVQ
jgi:hypothetical protein